jgi:hypothetical protein
MTKVTQTIFLEMNDKEFQVLYKIFDKLSNYGDTASKIGMLPDDVPTIQKIWDDLNAPNDEI